MHVGLIVYSHTGNTLSVAKRVEDAIAAAGHTVSLVRVETVNDAVRLVAGFKSTPDPSPYGVLIFASPVHAFSLAIPMKTYLSQLPDLKGKKVYCFVTQHLKKSWLGGNRAVRQIMTICQGKGAEVVWGGVVNWSAAAREKQIDEIVARFGSI